MRTVPLSFRCDQTWEDLEGDRDRHCARCEHTVHDLSARSSLEARWLRLTRPRACVRFEVAADGRIRHRRSRLRQLVTALIALGSAPASADPVHLCSTDAPSDVRVQRHELDALVTTALIVRIVDPDEIPIPGVTILLEGPTTEQLETDQNGVARWERPQTGIYRGTIRKQGFAADAAPPPGKCERGGSLKRD